MVQIRTGAGESEHQRLSIVRSDVETNCYRVPVAANSVESDGMEHAETS